MEVKNKLQFLSYILNNEKVVDCSIHKHKYYLYYDFETNEIKQGTTDSLEKIAGVVYCLSQKFRDEALSFIGITALKDFLINY